MRLIAALALVALLGVGAVAGVMAAGPDATQALTGHGRVPKGTPYPVGRTAPTSGLEITLHGVTDPFTSPDRATQPSPGDRYIAVDVEVANPRASRFVFSFLIAFHLLTPTGHQIEATILPGLQPAPPDGTIAGGGSRRGLVLFEVPDSATGLRLRAQGKATAAGAVFRIP